MDKRFLGILVAIIVIFIGVFAVSQHSNNKSGSGSSHNSSQPTNHITGEGKKGVTLIEYGDYQCPVCEAYYQPLKQAYTQLSQDIFFQFRNLPLPIHNNAYAAARAAEAAGLQGKYWQMHDVLYENQNSWASSTSPLNIYKSYAQQLGLDVNKFSTDYTSERVNNSIQADINAFSKTGKDEATPTLFLDGKALDNASLTDPQTGIPSVDKIAAVISAEITAKNKQ
ncbi:MAG TPA: thioredoxin domain-containing protein [Candidatus Saccharimonadales bacterium]|nr:thioredoxin domain-containing protein [Candidatus Saccharimonadales bacterium]